MVIAHLGNGTSMTAVRQGKSVDTTMGFTPAGGLVMSTRSGDLDPGVLVYLLEQEGVKVSALNDMVNRKSGLLGVSGISPDMKDLLDKGKKKSPCRSSGQSFLLPGQKVSGGSGRRPGGGVCGPDRHRKETGSPIHLEARPPSCPADRGQRLTDIALNADNLSLPPEDRYTTCQLSAHLPANQSTGVLISSGKTDLKTLDTNCQVSLRDLDLTSLKPYIVKQGGVDVIGKW